MTDFVVKRDADSDDLLRNIKRSKKDNDPSKITEGSVSQNILFEFKSSKVLSDSAREKNIFIHGKVKLFFMSSTKKKLKLQWQLYGKGNAPVMNNRKVNCIDNPL